MDVGLAGILREYEVVDATVNYLRENGWYIEGQARGKTRGPDIIASRGGHRLIVEAKGEGSSEEASARYGRPFDGGQVRMHVARAVYTAMSVIDRRETEGAVALPSTALHREYVKAIQSSLDTLQIAVLWVDRDRRVIEDRGSRRFIEKFRR
jgi:hypothetical protein